RDHNMNSFHARLLCAVRRPLSKIGTEAATSETESPVEQEGRVHHTKTALVRCWSQPSRYMTQRTRRDSADRPQMEASTSWTMWTTGTETPAALNPERSCSRHPGLPEATMSGVVASRLRTLRSPNSLAGSGRTRL